jgi:hypothetical protein
VPITTNVVSLNPVHGEMYSLQHYVMKFVSDLRHVGGFLWVFRIPLSQGYKNMLFTKDRITEIQRIIMETETTDKLRLVTTLCDEVCQWLATCRWFSLGIPDSSTNTTQPTQLRNIYAIKYARWTTFIIIMVKLCLDIIHFRSQFICCFCFHYLCFDKIDSESMIENIDIKIKDKIDIGIDKPKLCDGISFFDR